MTITLSIKIVASILAFLFLLNALIVYILVALAQQNLYGMKDLLSGLRYKEQKCEFDCCGEKHYLCQARYCIKFGVVLIILIILLQ